jgi:hypothetical protein
MKVQRIWSLNTECTYVFCMTTKRSNHSLQGINLWTAVKHVFSALWMSWIFKCYLDKVWASSLLPVFCWRAYCDNHLLPATSTIKHTKSSVFWDVMLCSLKICAMSHRNTLLHIQYQKVTHGTHIKPNFQLWEFKWEELYSGCTEQGVQMNNKSLHVLCLTQYHSDHTGWISS